MSVIDADNVDVVGSYSGKTINQQRSYCIWALTMKITKKEAKEYQEIVSAEAATYGVVEKTLKTQVKLLTNILDKKAKFWDKLADKYKLDIDKKDYSLKRNSRKILLKGQKKSS